MTKYYQSLCNITIEFGKFLYIIDSVVKNPHNRAFFKRFVKFAYGRCGDKSFRVASALKTTAKSGAKIFKVFAH